MRSQEIFNLRKEGFKAEALRLARAEYSNFKSDIWYLRAYVWTLYDHIRSIVEAYERQEISPHLMSNQITPYMREFIKISGALRKDSAFSQVIRLSGKVSNDWEHFLSFAHWAGVDSLQPEDCEPFLNEHGKEIDSLKKRFIRAICRSVAAKSTNATIDPHLIDWGVKVLREALLESPNDIWLNYYQSKLHLANGQSNKAVQRLVPIVRKQLRASWLWALLAEVLEANQQKDALICYAQAVQTAQKEQEIAKTRIHLARLLALEQRYLEAAEQTKLALKFRQTNNFKVPRELQELESSNWFKKAKRENKFKELQNSGQVAMELLVKLDQRPLVYSKGVIDHINEKKGLSYIKTSDNGGVPLMHHKFPTVLDQMPGTVVEIGRAELEGPVLEWKISETITIPELCEKFSGDVDRRDGNSFAFLRSVSCDVFIPPDLAKNFTPNIKVSRTCLALKRKNKQGVLGWCAVRFINNNI
jgi:hypothetical protein